MPRPSREEAERFPAVSGAPTPPSTPSPVSPESGRSMAQSKHRGSTDQTGLRWSPAPQAGVQGPLDSRGHEHKWTPPPVHVPSPRLPRGGQWGQTFSLK